MKHWSHAFTVFKKHDRSLERYKLSNKKTPCYFTVTGRLLFYSLNLYQYLKGMG